MNINKIHENGKELTDSVEIADTINKFYVNIGKSVEQKIPKVDRSFLYYLRNRNPYNIVLNPCSAEEVRKYISDMLPSKATGPNSIPTRILKEFIDELVEPLVDLINKSLDEGVFPDVLKCASVCPIYK